MRVLQTVRQAVGAAAHSAVDARVANRVDGGFASRVRAGALQEGTGFWERSGGGGIFGGGGAESGPAPFLCAGVGSLGTVVEAVGPSAC